tara:strand:- start:144 stop:527 length:384 start_codon:yes stop_codon:yes gene_type:complete
MPKDNSDNHLTLLTNILKIAETHKYITKSNPFILGRSLTDPQNQEWLEIGIHTFNNKTNYYASSNNYTCENIPVEEAAMLLSQIVNTPTLRGKFIRTARQRAREALIDFHDINKKAEKYVDSIRYFL